MPSPHPSKQSGAVVSVPEAAAILGITRTECYGWLNAQPEPLIPHRRRGSRYVILRADVERLAREGRAARPVAEDSSRGPDWSGLLAALAGRELEGTFGGIRFTLRLCPDGLYAGGPKQASALSGVQHRVNAEIRAGAQKGGTEDGSEGPIQHPDLAGSAGGAAPRGPAPQRAEGPRDQAHPRDDRARADAAGRGGSLKR